MSWCGRALSRFGAAISPVVVVAVCLVPGASAAGGEWDHLGTGAAPGTAALNGAVYALAAAPSFAFPNAQALYVGGAFTAAGGDAAAGRIAQWNDDGTAAGWSSVGPALNGDVHAIAYAGGKLYVGGNFTNAGGNPDADFLAVWDGVSWAPFCSPAPAFNGNVLALQVVGSTLYVGGVFLNGAGFASADSLLACDLTTGTAHSVVSANGDISGGVYALAADSAGTLYAGGQFTDMAGIAAADHVAAYDGTWHALGTGPSVGGGAVDDYVRSLASDGTGVYIGTDSVNVASIPQADHVARWTGSAWSALGADGTGSDGWFPAGSAITSLLACQSCATRAVYAGGSFQNAGGDPLADNLATFDGTRWLPIGSNGAGDGALKGNVTALASYGGQVVAGGNFTSAGADPLATSIARTTPPGPPAPTPVPGPTPPAVTPPATPSPVVTALVARALAVPGASSGSPPRALQALLASAPLAAALRAPSTATRVTTTAASGGAAGAPSAGVQRRLASLAYGLPVTVRSQAASVVDVAAAIVVAQRIGGATRVTRLVLPAATAPVSPGLSTVRVPVDAVAARVLQAPNVLSAAVVVQGAQVDVIPDALAAALQQAMGRLSKLRETLSNILAKISNTSTSLTRSGKASITRATPRSTLLRRAAALRAAANAEGEHGAALLAGIVGPHLGTAPHATLVLRACPKRCAFPPRAR